MPRKGWKKREDGKRARALIVFGVAAAIAVGFAFREPLIWHAKEIAGQGKEIARAAVSNAFYSGKTSEARKIFSGKAQDYLEERELLSTCRISELKQALEAGVIKFWENREYAKWAVKNSKP